MFTVIMAAHNAEKHIKETLQSLLTQQYQDWNCIIITNGCTDKTEEIVNSHVLFDTRIESLNLNLANKSAAVNAGIIAANGDWLAILDTDDLWTPNKLKLQHEFITKNLEVDVLGTQLRYIDSSGQPMKHILDLPTTNENILNYFDNNSNAIANSSVVYRRDLHKCYGYYDVELFGVEDYDWWKRLSRQNINFRNLDEECLFHRVHSNSNFNSSNKQLINKQLIDQIDAVHKCKIRYDAK